MSDTVEKNIEIMKNGNLDKPNPEALELHLARVESRDRYVRDCSPFIVRENEKFGQYLVAGKDLLEGSKILDESPAFFGPSADFVEDYETPLCLGCCVVMNDGNESHRCPKCDWPICGMNCEKLIYHEENECPIFAERNVPFPPNVVIQHCYKGLTVLRGLLLKEKSPETWGNLMTLQYQTQLQNTPFPDFSEFKKDFGLPDFGLNEDWERVLGILNVNSYSIQRIEKKPGSPSFAEFIYFIQSLMNHSCVPNCTWAVSYSPEFVLKVRPAVNIKEGELLTVPYNYDFSKYGAGKRQTMIRGQAEFNCRCVRCQDPTDLGTFSAGIICFKCKSGVVLPVDSLDSEGDWKCGECNYVICQSFVDPFVGGLYEQVEMAVDEAEDNDEMLSEILENFISKNSGSALHPNHWVLTEASQAIIKCLAKNVEMLSETQLSRMLWHCEHLLKIRDVISPGMSTSRGILHHHIARALLRKTEIGVKCNAFGSKEEINDVMRKVYDVQNNAYRFWTENPHYSVLHEDYKKDAENLIKDMEHVKNTYFDGRSDAAL